MYPLGKWGSAPSASDNGLSSVLLTEGFLEVIGLENPFQLCLANQDIAKEAP